MNIYDTSLIPKIYDTLTVCRMLANDHLDVSLTTTYNYNIKSNYYKTCIIENFLLRVPLPVTYGIFYDFTDTYKHFDCIQVFNNINLFKVLDEFVNKDLLLTDCNLFPEYNNKSFKDLPRNIQRRIEEQPLLFHVLPFGTPNDIKNEISARVVTILEIR